MILIIDDNELVRETLVNMLERDGYSTTVACDGDDGIKRLNETAIDLVITDILMPRKEGMETIAQIRRDHPGMKIIAISGGGEIGQHARNGLFLDIAKKLGADATLAKPFRPKELKQAVGELLQT